MKVIIICGPTGSGKSDVALELAEKLNSEIINFDSVQMYKDLDIGSAKPSIEMQQKIKHHLIGFCDLSAECTAGDFRRQALKILESQKSKASILVGGTGFYLNALLNGMFDIPPISSEIKIQVQEELKALGNQKAFEKLEKIDPAYTKKIHVNDSYRVARGFEIWYGLGKTPSEVSSGFEKTPFPYETIKIGIKISREDLRKNIVLRTRQMLKSGFIDEVIGLRRRFPGGSKGLNSVGYKEVGHFLDGYGTEVELEERIVTSTMQLAKRQVTWFKRDPEIHWMEKSQVLNFVNIS